MEKVPRVLGMLAAGGVMVASNVLCYQSMPRHGFGIIDFLHFAFYLAIYVFANLLIEEGRARERQVPARERQESERGAR